MWNKKGVDLRNTVILIIIFIIAAFLLTQFTSQISSWITGKSSVETCRVSVIGAAQLGEGTIAGTIADNWEIECPPREVEIYDDYYTVDDTKSRYQSDDYEENVKKVFADQMAECWYKMGEGEIDAYDDSFFIGTDSVCFYCSHIQFDDAPVYSINGLTDYLKKENMVSGLQGQTDLTYYNYIYRNYDFWWSEDYDNIYIYQDDIYTDFEYSIVFRAASIKFESPVIDEDLYYINMVPSNIPLSKCDYYYE
ncbi:hypothetical protein COV16_03610 [Candidatus Woesearchaeota archaeon CG10_big_fil_rev_8_21_14_0_10_34_8]|nr:MAG: hypothetical protein COV16_03610 [Candidatus Woesearchaeota archaeon CG10_big_fil_rev_8_21_14_0_10_34_8]